MRTLRIHGTQVNFPDACLVCLGSGHRKFKLDRTFTYGRRSIVLSLDIPMCYDHLKIASSKTTAQAWTERLSPVTGAGLGLAGCASLLWYWSVTGQGSWLWNIPLALFVGVSVAVPVWAAGWFWVAPLFASARTKEVLRAFQMKSYDPFREVLELEFVNDTAAELTARENLATLLVDREHLRQYRLSAHILDHDIRLNTRIRTQVLLDRPPTEKEARELLQPAIDRLMVQQMGVDTFYDVDLIEIEEVTQG